MNCSVEVKSKINSPTTYTKSWGSSDIVWKEVGGHDDAHKIAQGTTMSTRIGRQISIIKDRHRYHFSCVTKFDPVTYSLTHETMQFHVRVVGILFGRQRIPITDTPAAVDDAAATEPFNSGVFLSNDLLTFMNRNLYNYRKFFDRTYTMSMLPSANASYYSAATAPTEFLFTANVPTRRLVYADNNTDGALSNGISQGYHQFWVITDQKDVDISVRRDPYLKWTDQ